jgi:regulator of RNase E activity RraA
MDQDTLKDACARFSKLYSGAIADRLDQKGFRNQILPYYITPLTEVQRLCGVAFTGLGEPSENPADDDTQKRLAMLESIPPMSVSVWACGGHTESAHWGEIMSTAARERGCVGAVLDGGVRDIDFINAMRFPVFARFKCAGSSLGRWNIGSWQVPIQIGRTVIHPGDFVFGDTDGVVIIPQDLTLELLAQAEQVCARETGMRGELQQGVSIKDAYKKYGTF